MYIIDGGITSVPTFAPAPVPAPDAIALLGLAGLVVGIGRRRRA